MLRQIPIDTLGQVDLVEQAVLQIPVSYFTEQKGISFEEKCDDLDWYEESFFTWKEKTPFALIHYRGNPENYTSIYLDRGLHGAELQGTLEDILNGFGLPKSSVAWLHEGG
jgi:hypothetical protein